jgi:hypothetical protein
MKKIFNNPKVIYALLGVILSIFLFFIIIKPGITGYAVYQEAKKNDLPVEEYAKGIESLKSELQAAVSDFLQLKK